MKDFTLKKFEVKDGRYVAKFLIKTDLKKTLFDLMFPQDNPNLPKNWVELRKHLQSVHEMSDAEFKELQKTTGGNFQVALTKYAADFPAAQNDFGKALIDIVIEIFAEDSRYEALVDFLAHMFQVEKEEIENLSMQEAIDLIRKLMSDSGFLALLQPSTPESKPKAE